MLAEDGEHRLGDALNQLFGQAGGNLGVVAAGGIGEPQEAVEAREADSLTKTQEALAVQVKHLVEESAEVVPMLIRESDSGVGGFLAEVLPVAPPAHVFQVPKGGEAGVGEHEDVDAIGEEHRGVHGDDGTKAVTGECGVLDFESVHDRQSIGSLISGGKTVARKAAVAVAAEVERRHAERAAQDSHGLAKEPDREVAGDAVDQDDVRPGACLLIVKVDSVGDEFGHGFSPPHSKVRYEECNELSDREIARRTCGRPRRSAHETGACDRSVSGGFR